MNIRNPRELKKFAAERLENARDEKRIVMIYAALILGLSVVVTVADYVLELQMDQLGGLSNLSTRTVLSSLQSVIPVAQTILTICLDVGYIAAMLRIARGQYASPNTLRLGFDRFWVLMRCNLFKALYFSAVLMVSLYLGIMLFMLTPLSDSAMGILTPYLADMSILDSGVTMSDASYAAFSTAVVPAYLICGVLFCVLALPMLYSYRMAEYVIIDKPGMGAMAALRESRKMMRGKRLQLLKLDVSMWWFFGAQLLAMVVCYGDMILPMLGVELPWHEDISYFMFYVLYLGLMFAVYYFLRNRVDVSYALFYDSVKPEEKKDDGVVLGNIFQM